MLKYTLVLRRGAHEDSHFVEANAGGSLHEYPARDLDALASFARRREPNQFTCRVALWRRIEAKEVSGQPRQIRTLVFIQEFGWQRSFANLRDGEQVAVGDGEARLGRSVDHSPEKLSLSLGIEGHVEKKRRHRQPRRVGRGQDPGRLVEQRRAITDAGLYHQLFQPVQEAGQIRPALRQPRQRVGRDASQPKVEQGVGEGFGKSGRTRDRQQVLERLILGGFGTGTGRDCLLAEC